MTKLRNIAALSALILGGLTAASANIITAGQTAAPDVFFPVATTLAQSSGTLTATSPVPGVNGFSDSYTVGVSSDLKNAFCVGCLDFYYYFTNNGPGINERFSAASFDGYRTDVGYVGYITGPRTPATVDRSSNGAVVGFNFTGAATLTPGQTTSILVIETDARNYQAGTFTIQDGVTATGVGYAPAAAVPEPASLALFGTGLLGAVGVIRRKFAC